MKIDAKDWYVMLHLGGCLSFSAAFVWSHPEHFDGWCIFVGSIITAFHGISVHDDKTPDATHASTTVVSESHPP